MGQFMFARRFYVCIVFVVLQGCTNQSQSDVKPGVNTPPVVQPTKKAEWITFQSPDAPYSVLLPSQPIKRAQETPEGVLNKFICPLNIQLVLMTCATDMKDANLTNAAEYNFCFDAAMNAAIREAQGKVTEQQTFLLQDKYPTRAFTATYNTPQAGTGNMRLRLILTEQKLIQLMIAGTDAEMLKPEVSLFLESIKIHE